MLSCDYVKMELEIAGNIDEVSRCWNISTMRENAFLLIPSPDCSCESPGGGESQAPGGGVPKDRLGFVLGTWGLLWAVGVLLRSFQS